MMIIIVGECCGTHNSYHVTLMVRYYFSTHQRPLPKRVASCNCRKVHWLAKVNVSSIGFPNRLCRNAAILLTFEHYLENQTNNFLETL